MRQLDIDAETESQDPAIAIAKLAERQKLNAEQSKERHEALLTALTDLKALVADMASQVVQLRQSHTVADGDVTRLAESHKTQAEALAVLDRRVSEHGKEIGGLKNWKYWLTGIGSAVAVIGGTLWGWVSVDIRDARREMAQQREENQRQTYQLQDVMRWKERQEGRQ